ncbi:uroporphyrinogen decarboxylase family protein [Geomonas sp. Red32]|uniref:uroporphyrinogen decarboxylase family protein n=1 Tax=Geomonas sp. Red32 TaxID=2912856 RepID=UPI00202CC207|nr:uroporphyrinogen decarboxylase family protein [Geomonas sp. Red32]MCM0083808.1 uroporphyrinogen decarboxylase family protein [Geomonas sp. Red32]
MNSYQRVMGTLTGQPVDRVPVFAVLGAYGAKLSGASLNRIFTDPASYAESQTAVQTTFGLDLVMTPFIYTFISESFGGETAWSEHQVPNMKRPGIGSPAKLLSTPMPAPEDVPRLSFILEATRQLAKSYREKVPVIGVLPGPCIMPSLMMGIGPWMETVLFEETLARKVLDHTNPFFVSLANALLAQGADCLVITEAMATVEIAPRALFEERFLPVVAQTFSQIRGPKVFHHTGGRINHVIDLLPGLDGLAGVAIGSRDDLGEARRLVGGETNLIGNLDNLGFASSSATEIYEMSRRCLLEGAPHGHYILSNSGADIPLSASPDTVHAMKRAAEDHAGARREPHE